VQKALMRAGSTTVLIGSIAGGDQHSGVWCLWREQGAGPR